MLMPRKPWCRSRLGLTSYRHFRHRLLEDSHSPRQNRFRYHYDNHHWVATASVGGSAVLEDSLYKISANLERQLCELYNLAHIHLGKPTCENPPFPCIQQKDLSSCGQYAAAYEIASSCNTSDADFDDT